MVVQKRGRDKMQIDFKGLLLRAEKMGAQETELFFEDLQSSEIKVYEREVESLVSSRPRGLGVRIFKDDQMGFAYTSDLTQEGLRLALEKALENAMVVQKNSLKSLPPLYHEYPTMDFYNPLLAKERVEDKIEHLLKLEEMALSYEERIVKAPEVGYSDGMSHVMLYNSRGLELSFKRNLCYSYIVVLAREGEDVQTGVALTHGRSLHELDIEKTVREACQEALALLGARQVPSQKAPILFKPEVGASIIDLLGDALTAEAVQKKRSLFAGKLGQEVASPLVNLIDDGLLKEGLASQPFDGEGVPSQTTQVIREGLLETYLYDTYTSRKEERESTGNAVRSSYKGIPGVSPTNLFLSPGKKSQKELLSSVENGLYVQELSGLHSGANPISGDFSVGASGRWIHQGEFGESVREVTIAGNLMDLLKGIVAVASDLTFNPMVGSAGAPTFLVDSLSIGGS